MLVARALKNSQLIRQLPDETHVSYGTGHLNQSLRDRDARGTIGIHSVPQLRGESVDEFCLPQVASNASLRVLSSLNLPRRGEGECRNAMSQTRLW
jgi:hypothetical protein